MDRALYAAPQGLDQLEGMDDEEPLQITVVDPESVDIEGPGFSMHIEPADEEEDDFDDNLAESMSEGDLAQLAGDLIEDYDSDIASRRDWVQTYVDGLQLLGLKLEERMEPWPGACGVYHPLLAEAVVKFQAETMMETFPAAGPFFHV
jgi:hypothetical protein